MNSKKIILSMLLCLGLCSWAYSQNPSASELLMATQKFLDSKPHLKAEMQYSLYKGTNNPVVEHSYEGLMIKNKNDVYLKIHHTEIINQGGEYLKINHQQKAMEYVEGDFIEQNPLDIKKYLEFFEEKKVKDMGDYWLCTLTTPKITQLPYSSIVFHIAKEDYQLRKQTLELFSSSLIAKGNKKQVERSYLEIEIKSLDSSKHGISSSGISSFVTVVGGSMKAIAPYESYKLFNRTQK